VLDKGQVAEFGPPHELLQKPDGLFARMVDSSAQQAPRIRKLILEAHQRRAPSPSGSGSGSGPGSDATAAPTGTPPSEPER